MKKEQWEYVVANWGTSDPVVMEQIAKIKDEDELTLNELMGKIEERDKKIIDLTNQNVDLNKTNMNLILRLTDPSIAKVEEKEEEEYVAPSIDDYDSFVKED